MVEPIKKILKEEREEAALGVAEMEIRKAENMLVYEDEIKARAPRTWIVSEKEKLAASEASSQAHRGKAAALPSSAGAAWKGGTDDSRSAKSVHRKSIQQMNGHRLDAATAAITRAIKRAKKPVRMTVFTPDREDQGGSKKKKRNTGATGFAEELVPGSRKASSKDGGAKPRKAKKKASKGELVEKKDRSMIKKAPVKKFKSKKKYKRR